MSLKRTFAIVFICGLFSFVVDAALDGDWPSHSLLGWGVLVGGLVVIAFVFHGAEAMYERWQTR